ncbi:MAG: hypothetical protein Kow0062_00360 [Acidobacteriota bacterium]
MRTGPAEGHNGGRQRSGAPRRRTAAEDEAVMTSPVALIGPLGTQELLLLFLIIALLFGARKLPELGKGVGEAIRNFRGAMKTASEDADKDEGSSNAS